VNCRSIKKILHSICIDLGPNVADKYVLLTAGNARTNSSGWGGAGLLDAVKIAWLPASV